MPGLLFPWRWAPAGQAVVVVPPTPPLWGTVTVPTQTWNASRPGLLPRFEHVYPMVSGQGFGAPISLEYRVQSEFAHVIATEGQVVIASSSTAT